jgi:hypothetical protein
VYVKEEERRLLVCIVEKILALGDIKHNTPVPGPGSDACKVTWAGMIELRGGSLGRN